MNQIETFIKNKSQILFPKDSLRRLVFKTIYKIFLFPFKLIFKLIYQFVVIYKVKKYYYKDFIKNNIEIFKTEKNKEKISDYEPIILKKENNPAVSIIIPVYNQFNYTYNCIKSIKENSGDEISYEIIIADDCSNDLTTQIEQIVSNITVVKTIENLRFLKNCNNAAKYANGKYILLLNNDTQVQKNWLSPLVRLIESDEKIGAVGSKMLLKNGLIFEAVSIIWNDGSAFNYGRNCYPGLPEFNYVKEVDYLSGAAIMIKKSIWNKIGGFDEHFTPAYYEDPDLCFSIRKMGYKVMYQPESVVVHFEGISNGTNVNKSQKSFQIVNKNKFYEKWKDVLEKENFPIDENIFYARDRSKNKKTLLFIDVYVPLFDRDAGSRSVFHYLSYFINNGFNVKFIGDDFIKHEPYTGILEKMGIEVLYGQYYKNNWKKWVKENGKYFDYIFLNRPYIAIKYIKIIKKYTKAKLFYIGHDLHYIRDLREYELKKEKHLLKESERWEKIEYSLMKNSDVSYFVSTEEIRIIKEANNSINCKLIPINIFSHKENRIFDNSRKDLLFVGGFKHTPNIDAVLWFIDNIFDIVKKSIPDIILYIIGSNVPDVIQKLNNKNVKVIGYVEDNVLEDYYKKCRVSIVPLRYGAGVKGKVTEAMYYQMPVITTSIGAEGLPEIENYLIIENEPELFADRLINMYNDYELLNKLSENGLNYINKYFSVNNMKNIIQEDIY